MELAVLFPRLLSIGNRPGGYMKSVILGILSALMVIPNLASAQYKVGEKVPEFKLPYATKDTIVFDGIGSADLAGKRYLLAFYPADWSPGCTKEVCRFRDSMTDFEDLNLIVIGVSVDNLFSHRQWAKYENLNFKLLSDQTHKLGMNFGVYDENKGVFKRSVFVIGPDGRFEYINYNYSVNNDDDFHALKKFLAAK
jgi:peroxiredoxin